MTGSRSFSRKERLASGDIAALLASARGRRAAGVLVQTRENATPRARLGLIIPKRNIPTAVGRNRAKRLLREWFRHHKIRMAGRDVLIRVTGTPRTLEALIVEVDRLLADKA